MTPDTEEQAHTIPTLTAEVIFYAAREAVRNAAKHGRSPETDEFCLQIHVNWHDGLEIIIEDNGIGLGAASPNSRQRSRAGAAQHDDGRHRRRTVGGQFARTVYAGDAAFW